MEQGQGIMVIDKKLYTYAEYAAIVDLPENRNRLLELIDGEIVEKMASFTPSKIAFRFGRVVGNFVEAHDLGELTGADGSFKLSELDTFIPDFAFVAKQRLSHEPEREFIGPSDLAVEVKSPTDSKRELRKKAEKYLEYGTRMVWLVFPEDELVEVYVPDEDVITVSGDAILEGRDVLPGFRLPARDIFK